MVQVSWTLLALEDLKEIYDYIERDSAKYARLQVVKIKARTAILKKWPMVGKVVEDIGNPAIRELVEGNYRIIYRVLNKEEIHILTIHHSSRDLSNRRLI